MKSEEAVKAWNVGDDFFGICISQSREQDDLLTFQIGGVLQFLAGFLRAALDGDDVG